MRIFVALIAVFLANMAIADLQFPQLDADDLNGRSVSLPQDLPGDPTIVFIAYKRKSAAKHQRLGGAFGLARTWGGGLG
jgi:hypothetical protein